jgi:hypothetical protein
MINMLIRNYRLAMAFPLFLFAILTGLLTACTVQPDLHPDSWRYGIDPYGSSATYGKSLIEDGAVRIVFNRVGRPSADRNPWIELIYDAPQGNLAGAKSVRLTYQCSEPLLMKFSQKDYGGDGDKSYAHYQMLLPAAKDWHTVNVNVTDTTRPSWTPTNSKDLGLILENVSAIYLTPVLDDLEGGQATLNVKAIEFLPTAEN